MANVRVMDILGILFSINYNVSYLTETSKTLQHDLVLEKMKTNKIVEHQTPQVITNMSSLLRTPENDRV